MHQCDGACDITVKQIEIKQGELAGQGTMPLYTMVLEERLAM